MVFEDLMKKFNALPILLLTLPLMLAGCLDDESNDDDPNDDSNWSLIPDQGGLGNTFSRFEDDADLTALVAGTLSPECVAIDTNGDSTNDGSKSEAFNFVPDASGGGSGTYTISVFLADTACSTGTADYTDVAEFDYEAWSSSFDFNRIDITMTTIGRVVKTDAAATALNGASACNKTDWEVSESLVPRTNCSSDDADIDKLIGSQFNDSEAPIETGTVLEGIYIVSGSLLSIAIEEDGGRPSASVDRSSNDYWLISGAEIYYVY